MPCIASPEFPRTYCGTRSRRHLLLHEHDLPHLLLLLGCHLGHAARVLRHQLLLLQWRHLSHVGGSICHWPDRCRTRLVCTDGQKNSIPNESGSGGGNRARTTASQ
jgi:hypothetical protein